MKFSEFKKLTLKKNKYRAEKAVIDGIKFDSKAEGEMYQLLKADPSNAHIDCHVPVTLPGGIRFNIDFVVYPKFQTLGSIFPKAVEVKGFPTQDFKRMRKLFDAFHPLRPLKVYRKEGKNWVEI